MTLRRVPEDKDVVEAELEFRGVHQRQTLCRENPRRLVGLEAVMLLERHAVYETQERQRVQDVVDNGLGGRDDEMAAWEEMLVARFGDYRLALAGHVARAPPAS